MGAASAAAQTLTQSTDPNTVTNNNSIACTIGGYHSDNSYYRAYSIAANATITSVRLGIEEDTGGPNPMQIRLYTTSIASGIPTLASLTPIGATTNVLTPGNALWNTTVQTIPLSLPVNVTIGQRVVVEVFTPNNTAVGGSFYIGSNQAGELTPGYLGSPQVAASPIAFSRLSRRLLKVSHGIPDVHHSGSGHGAERNRAGIQKSTTCKR